MDKSAKSTTKYKKKFPLSKQFLYYEERPVHIFSDNLMKSKENELYCTIGKVATEKLQSLRSKLRCRRSAASGHA